MSGTSTMALGTSQVAPRTPTSAPASQGWPYRSVKRGFDIAFSLLVIVVGFVPAAILAAFVIADTKGSPIYTQERIGVGGKPFRIFKFRTMVADADDVEKYLDAKQLEAWHRERKVEDDPRITPLGRFLRKTSIDEFPQFLNVLVGQMSTIGPRAITEEELEWYLPADREAVLSIRPGITGLWQIGPRNEVAFDTGARQLIELSYVANANATTDAKIFFKTFRAMVSGTGQ